MEDLPWGQRAQMTKEHAPPETVQLSDDPVTMQKLVWDDPDLNSSSATEASQAIPTSDLSIEDILNQALRRGGSSLEAVLKFDRMLMEEVKGIVPVLGGGASLDDLRLAGETTAVLQCEVLKSNIHVESPPLEAARSESGTMLSDSVTGWPAQAEGSSSNEVDRKLAMTAKGFLRSVIRKPSQDDQGPSSDANESPLMHQRVSTSVRAQKALQDKGITAGPSSKLPKITIPFTSKCFLKRKSTRAKSPKKRKGRKAEEPGAEDCPTEDPARQPLTAHSIIQQVSLFYCWFVFVSDI
jgi:hypothetical protein